MWPALCGVAGRAVRSDRHLVLDSNRRFKKRIHPVHWLSRLCSAGSRYAIFRFGYRRWFRKSGFRRYTPEAERCTGVSEFLTSDWKPNSSSVCSRRERRVGASGPLCADFTEYGLQGAWGIPWPQISTASMRLLRSHATPSGSGWKCTIRQTGFSGLVPVKRSLRGVYDDIADKE